MDKPKWQRVRIKQCRVSTHMNKRLWVLAEPPKTLIGVDDDGERHPAAPLYKTNLIAVDSIGATYSIHASQVELLPEFADEVSLITVDEFNKGDSND